MCMFSLHMKHRLSSWLSGFRMRGKLLRVMYNTRWTKKSDHFQEFVGRVYTGTERLSNTYVGKPSKMLLCLHPTSNLSDGRASPRQTYIIDSVLCGTGKIHSDFLPTPSLIFTIQYNIKLVTRHM